MNYSVIKTHDVSNGPGCRVSLFVSGCSHHCKDCFQPETWSPKYGQPFTKETEEEIIEALKKPYIKGFSVLGGDPFYKSNAYPVLKLIGRVREEFPEKDIFVWTGFTWEELTPHLLTDIDVLVDGKFEIDKKDLSLKWRGSSNQRVINVPETLQKGNVILLEE